MTQHLLLVFLFVAFAHHVACLDSTTSAPGCTVGDGIQTPASLQARETHMEVLHEDARIYRFRNFLSPAECDALIAAAAPNMQPSKLATGPDTRIRTSTNTFLPRQGNELITAVEKRIAAWTLLPVYNGEDLQVVRYEPGQEFKAHMDYLFVAGANDNGGGRVATVLTYLNDVQEGGETIFPNLPAPPGEDRSGYSDCAKQVLAVKPRKGDAILFHSMTYNGTVDHRSLHASCPMIQGTKWALTKWIHMHTFTVPGQVAAPAPAPAPAADVDSNSKPADAEHNKAAPAPAPAPAAGDTDPNGHLAADASHPASDANNKPAADSNNGAGASDSQPAGDANQHTGGESTGSSHGTAAATSTA